jgi:hypothetical protein
MKKKLAILDENAHWWRKQKLDWAIQDKKGDWWIIPGSEFAEQKISNEDKMKIDREKAGQRSLLPTISFYMWIIFSSILGISLALNLLYLLDVL